MCAWTYAPQYTSSSSVLPGCCCPSTVSVLAQLLQTPLLHSTYTCDTALKMRLYQESVSTIELQLFISNWKKSATPLRVLSATHLPHNETDWITGLLFAAALSDQSRLISTMASRGANMNAADIHGKTPLHYAIAAGSAKERMGDLDGMARSCVTVKVLLRQGANLMVRDGQGKYPLTLASTNMSAVVEDEVYLIETGSDLQD